MATKSNKTSTNYMGSQSNYTDNLKYEVADELGVTLGADTPARDNGRVGGQITRELVSRGKQKVDQEAMKYETADELGVQIGPDASSRNNGRVGGSMTKKLVNKGKGSN